MNDVAAERIRRIRAWELKIIIVLLPHICMESKIIREWSKTRKSVSLDVKRGLNIATHTQNVKYDRVRFYISGIAQSWAVLKRALIAGDHFFFHPSLRRRRRMAAVCLYRERVWGLRRFNMRPFVLECVVLFFSPSSYDRLRISRKKTCFFFFRSKIVQNVLK